ncbi:hypothetical protein P2F94_03805, partial [Mannheimia haemolytica]|nr:hypothetical protein [Mannheimia haemolytica]
NGSIKQSYKNFTKWHLGRKFKRFHKTILQEFYQVAFRKKIYTDLTTLQADLDEWLMYYNHHRTHRGKMCCGRTPMATLLDGKRIWVEKNLSSN